VAINGNASAKGRGFQPGVSGNPGGRTAWSKACRDAGFDPAELSVEVIRRRVEAMRTMDPDTPSWREVTADLMNRFFGKPKESVDVNVGGPSPDQQALLDALRMTPHERRQAQAQDSTDVGDRDAAE
jgi:hypothetical protein